MFEGPFTYPHTLQAGSVKLPPSEPGILITLSKVTTASGGTAPVARSYDGYAWEGLAAAPLPLEASGPAKTFTRVVIPTTVAGTDYVLELYNASLPVLLEGNAPYLDVLAASQAQGPGPPPPPLSLMDLAPQRAAARLLVQATFGPTRADLSGPLSSNMSTQAVRAWITDQINMPATMLRPYLRRSTNPRLRTDLEFGSLNHEYVPGFSQERFLIGPPRAACSVGSRWHRFAFNSLDSRWPNTQDADSIVKITPNAAGVLEMTIGGELRTEMPLPDNYTIVTTGRCGVFMTHISSQFECLAAARYLGLTWGSNPNEARDDYKSVGSTNRPRGCYIKAENGYGYPDSILYTNVNDGNLKECSDQYICICKRDFNSTVVATASPPPPLPAPPAAPGYSDPTQCASWPSECCVVIYERAQGVQCNPVPIWDFANWNHPGGPQASASSLCGKVRYSWLSKNGAHGGDAKPEDVTKNAFAGGAVNVGTYVDPACAAAPPPATPHTAPPAAPALPGMEFRICFVEERLGGIIKMAKHDPSQSMQDNQNPCSNAFFTSTSEYYALLNPPIVLTNPDPALSQTFNTNDAILSQVELSDGPSDAFLLDAVPSSCNLSAQTPGYMRVGTTWYRHDRRLKLSNCTGTCDSHGSAEHPHTVHDPSFSGVVASLGEVANEPSRGHHFNAWMASENGFRTYMPFEHARNEAKQMVWTAVVRTASDQLRHRMAFALSQILVIGADGSVGEEQAEVYVSYYDIFVRNAFGSYYDVLREVAYSPQMAQYLTFYNNKRFSSRATLPDENFAREVSPHGI